MGITMYNVNNRLMAVLGYTEMATRKLEDAELATRLMSNLEAIPPMTHLLFSIIRGDELPVDVEDKDTDDLADPPTERP